MTETTPGSRASLAAAPSAAAKSGLPAGETRTCGASSASRVRTWVWKPERSARETTSAAHAENEPDERRRRDHSHLRVPARGEEVAACEQDLDQRPVPFGRMSGKRMTSRIDREFVKSIARRSIPTPSPAVGGIPYDSAST